MATHASDISSDITMPKPENVGKRTQTDEKPGRREVAEPQTVNDFLPFLRVSPHRPPGLPLSPYHLFREIRPFFVDFERAQFSHLPHRLSHGHWRNRKAPARSDIAGCHWPISQLVPGGCADPLNSASLPGGRPFT